MVNNSNQGLRNIRTSIITPIVVYLLSLILPAIVMIIPTMYFKWNTDYQYSHLYIIGTIGQLLMDLPAIILFTRLRNNSENKNGSNSISHDRIISIITGIVCAFLLAAMRIIVTGRLMGGRFMGGVPAFTQSLGLASPWNIIAAIMALLAYGPGEALFVVYLIIAFDKAVGNPRALISWGVIITSILWALPHIYNIVFFGVNAIPNVVIMLFIGIVMGILLKKTRSALGPMIFWTLVNGTSV